MYHYRECGLDNVYLVNGYREVDTPHGRAVAIENVQGLHRAIATDLIEKRPFLAGRELRFIRKTLDLTQARLGELIGVTDQSVRLWERSRRVPRQADRAIRLLYRDLMKARQPQIVDIIDRLRQDRATAAERIQFRHRPRARVWQPDLCQAA